MKLAVPCAHSSVTKLFGSCNRLLDPSAKSMEPIVQKVKIVYSANSAKCK